MNLLLSENTTETEDNFFSFYNTYDTMSGQEISHFAISNKREQFVA